MHCNVNNNLHHNLFSNHLLPVRNLIPVTRTSFTESWPSVFLLLSFSLLVLIKQSSFSRVLKIIQSSFSLQVLHQLEREESNTFRFSSLGLNAIFILNVGFLLYKINGLYLVILSQSNGLSQFLFFVLLILSVFGFKILFNAVVGYLSGERKIISEYAANVIFINQTSGLLLFPCIILIEFSPLNPSVFILLGVIILATSILLSWYRGVIIGLVEQRLGFLQIFSYFCTLEILPVFVLVKYIIETF